MLKVDLVFLIYDMTFCCPRWKVAHHFSILALHVLIKTNLSAETDYLIIANHIMSLK